MPRPRLSLPDGVRAMATRGPEWAAWVDGLPRTALDLVDAWGLTLDGAAQHGATALVVPVLDPDGQSAVLKVGFRNPASEHAHLVLQRWRGDGAVRMLRADPGRGALLLERLDARDLGDEWDVAACEVVGDLYQRLHVPAPPQLRTLSSCVERWTAELVDLPRSAPVPRRLVEQAVSLGRAFASDATTDGRVVHTDLHYATVLAGRRQPWSVIGPRPLDGDPHFEVAPLLWNRWGELAGDVRDGVRRRFHATIDAAGLDEDRARDWVVVRALHETRVELDRVAPDQARLTRLVTLAKAVQD